MSKKSIILLVVLSLLLSVFIGCNDDMIDTLKKVQAEVEISVKLPDELKTDDFKPEDFGFTLEWYAEGDSGNKNVEEFSYEENLKLVRRFDPGTYIFEIFGRESGTNKTKAHGMRSIAIEPGQREQLEIPMTYYVYGEGSGFKVEDGVITLSGKLEFDENKTISVPSGMKLVISDGTEIVGAGKTLKINGVVEAQGDLTIGGNLEITENFSVAGDLTFTGDNTLALKDGKDFVVGGNIIVTGNQEINADTIVGNLVFEDGSKLEVEGTLQVSSISGEGNLSVSGYVGGAGGNITITGSPQIDGDLFLEEDTTLDIATGATPKVTGSVETDGALTITGDSTLEVTGNLTVGGELTASDEQRDAVVGDITTNTLRFGRKPYFVAYIEEGETIELDEIDDGWETVVVSGGGTLKVGSVAASVEKITLDGDSLIEILGTLTIDEISGVGSLKADSIDVETLTATDGATLALTGPVTVVEVTGGGTVEFASPLTLEELSIGSGTTLKVDQLTKDTIKIAGGGTLEVSGDADLEKVELEDESSLVVTGELSGIDIEISGDGAVTAESIDVSNLVSDGNQTIKADTIKVDNEIILEGSTVTSDDDGLVTYRIFADSSIEAGKLTNKENSNNKIKASTIEIPQIVLEEGAKVSLDGEVITETISGPGSLTVNGVVKAKVNELSISSGATLEAEELNATKVTVEGSLKVNNDTTVETLVLSAGSTLEIDGTLQSETISGEGTLVADNVTTEELNNSGNLTITADTTSADEIELEDNKDLTLEGDVITGSILGNGTIAITGELGGKEGNITIKGEPTVAGDLHLEAGTTVEIIDGATLEITGNVVTDGALNISGSGTLEVAGDLTASGKFNVDSNVTVDVTGDISEDTLLYGTKPDLVVFIEPEEELILSKIDDGWKTITVTGGGTFKVEAVDAKAKIDKIKLEDGSKMEVVGTIHLAEGASLDLDGGATLEVTGDVVAADDLTVSGKGTLDAKGNLTVAGDFTTEVDVNVANKLDVEGDAEIDGDVVVGSLVMGDTSTITILENGSLTINDIEPTVLNNVVLADGGRVEVIGKLESGTISGSGTVTATSIDVTTLETEAEKSLTLTGAVKVEEVSGDGTAEIKGTLTVDTLSIASGATLEATGLEVDGDILTISGGGTLKVNSDTTLKEVVLENSSSLKVVGVLSGADATGIKVSGNGAVTAGSIVADKLTTVGAQSITAVNFDIKELAPEANKNLTLNGDVTTETVSGTVIVDGTLTVENLSITNDASLEASGLAAKDDTIRITDGGKLKVHNDTTVETLELDDDSKLEIDGTLQSDTISGEGTIVADSVITNEISNTGNLTITADSITADDEINLATSKTLTLDGDVITGKITGEGDLNTQRIGGGTDGIINIEGKPTITDDLMIDPDSTLSVAKDAVLTVDGEVKAWGDLTLKGDGKLSINGDLTVEKSLTNTIGELIVGNIHVDTPPYGEKPDLVLNIKPGKTFTMESIGAGWETVTVTGGGTLIVKDDTTLDAITLENDSKLEVIGNLASNTISGRGTVEAVNIDVNTVDVVDGRTLTLTGTGSLPDENGVVKVINSIKGSGTVEVNGPVTIDTLSIASGATLEASSLTVSGEKVTVAGSGTLKVSDNTTLKDIELEDGSLLVIYGNLALSENSTVSFDNNATLEASSLTVSGEKVTVAGSGTLKVSDNTTLKDIELEDGSLLVIYGNLELSENSTVSFEDNATLAVDGSVTADGNLTLNGGGTLDVTGSLDVEGTLTASADQLDVKGDINANSLSSGEGAPLGVNIEANQTLSVPNLSGHNKVTITGGGTLEITDAEVTTLGEIVFVNGSAMVVSGKLEGAGVDSELVLTGDGNLSADSIETSKLSTSGNQTITADVIIEVAEIEMSGDKTLTLTGDVKTNKISGEGKTVVTGTTTATNLVIGAGSTLDVSGSQARLDTSGEATVTGALNLGASGWGSVDFGVGATITLSGDDADLIIGGQPKWYTLYGAKAQYFKDGDIQLRFLEGEGEGEGEKKVTPAWESAVPTEAITRIGGGVNFDVTVTEKNKLSLAGKELILEAGSSTLIADNWWTLGNSIVLGSGTITVNAGATVKYGNNVTWIDNGSGEFVLTGSAQMKYSAAMGTKIINTESSGIAQLELKDWKSGATTTRQLNHFLTVEKNATVLISKDDDLIVGSGGRIVIEEDGTLIIDDDKELETTETNQLIIRGDVIVKDGATINIKDAMFTFDKNEQTGSVQLKSGSIWMAAGTVYYAPSTIEAGRRAISFNTDGVDLIFTPHWVGNYALRNYLIIGVSGKKTFSVNYSSGTSITVPSQTITVGDGATFEVNKSFNIAPTNASNSSITVQSGGTLKVVSGNTLKTGDDDRTIKIESGGKLENNGTIEINGSGKLDIAGEATIKNGGIIKAEYNDNIKFSNMDATLTVESGAKVTLPNNVWTASGGIGTQGKVVIKGGGILTYGPKGGTESNWFGGVGSESYFNLESNVQATLQGGANAAARSTTFSRINPSSSGNTSVFVQGLSTSSPGTFNILTPSGNMIIDGVEFTIQKNEFGNNANLEVRNNGSLVINASYGINTGKTVTIQSGSTLAIAQSGIIREVTTKNMGGGTFDIKNGGIVKIAGVTKPANVAATYSGKVTNHTVKYNGAQVFKHP